LVISQRLVKKNCENCLEVYQPSEKSLNSIKETLEKIEEKDEIQFIR
jgi:type II secretory ATPase GspE/PulE/Tfp pilus assembly ATPase PilB-like protein